MSCPSRYILALCLPILAAAQPERGPYARIAMLHPLEGHTVDFEAGYMRHLDWHRHANDLWSGYGWTVWTGEHQRWFVYATFAHTAASLDHSVAPADDERDNIINVAPHVDHWSNSLYEYLPALSRGDGEPGAASRLELTTVDLMPGSEAAFEEALRSAQPSLRNETLWYRLLAGGATPRYIRLRPSPSLSSLLEMRAEQPLVAKTSIDILNLRPTLSYGLAPPTLK